MCTNCETNQLKIDDFRRSEKNHVFFDVTWRILQPTRRLYDFRFIIYWSNNGGFHVLGGINFRSILTVKSFLLVQNCGR